MKKIELFFASLLIPLDFLMLIAAALTAYLLRFQALADIRPIIFDLPFSWYLRMAAMTAVLWLIIFALNGLYAISGPRKLVYELSRIAVACSGGMMILIIFIFFRRELFSSRFILLAAWFLSILFVWLGRLLVKMMRWILLRKGIGNHRVILVGTSKSAQVIKDAMKTNWTMGFNVVQQIPFKKEKIIEDLNSVLKEQKIDDVVLVELEASRQTIFDLIQWASLKHVGFRYAPDLFETRASNVEVLTIAGIPIVEIKKTRLEGWGRIYKRIFDIVGSALLIILTSPIMLITAIAIKLESKGPVFWSRRDNGEPVIRLGQYGRPFHYFKFRSMHPNTHQMRYETLAQNNTRKGPLVKIENDPRITRTGRFIRRYSLDELSEFFLVFIGKMSLVGPRPHFPEEIEKFKDHQKKALAIKPGITGLAQTSGRSDLDFDDEIKLDVFYMENWSMIMDIAILFKTPLAILRPRKAI